MRLDIIILNTSKAKRVVQNVQLLLEQKTNFSFQIVVVDNSENPEQIEILMTSLMRRPSIRLLLCPKSFGYPHGNNWGAQQGSAEYIAIINPDIFCHKPTTLQKCIDYLDMHKNVGVVGPKQKNEDGSRPITIRKFPNLFLQMARRSFLRNLPRIRKYVEADEMRHINPEKIQEVDWIQSSFLIIRRSLWKEIGGFYEQYFLFMSDAELCLETWKHGKKVIYFPEAEVTADGKRCSEGGFLTLFQKWTLRQHVRDALRYWWIHRKEDPSLFRISLGEKGE
ncbi:glycosyltransferase [Candidatus Peregrinibacteria bacterium]|nr:MAG: glycosyltransferase [Candidatus Peregrinibacteria bacterium]